MNFIGLYFHLYFLCQSMRLSDFSDCSPDCYGWRRRDLFISMFVMNCLGLVINTHIKAETILVICVYTKSHGKLYIP